MNFQYETERLQLLVCNEEYSNALLAFMTENKDFFAPYEPLRQPGFYTEEFQARVLRAEFLATLRSTYLRYYLFLKEDTEHIIGTVSFSGISRTDGSCRVGYKLDRLHTGRGYATEALRCLLPELGKSLQIHRVEADILLENAPSLRLIERLGFAYEGVARSSHEIGGIWRDHLRYSYIFAHQ
ncbi:MAG: GNAT family protein [Lachnospiraceae bacterium]|nr:GNAT family protein [Lachnospiraceae bacterium]